MSKIIGELFNRVKFHPRIKLIGQYKSFDQGLEAIEALTFWRFYRKILWDLDGLHNTMGHNTLRIKFLDTAIKNSSGLIQFVAKLERLPSKVIKTLLWKENIDFQSFESFLRRLTTEQVSAIESAYHELFELKQVPSCMLAGRRKWLHHSLTVEQLLEEPLYSKSRYTSKSAWVRNLASLDFGFGKYINGSDDDAVVQDTSRKFLSIKNHINDFTVNKHDGIYWWLYRTLRSNYLWNRYGEVQLSQHICPGFWFTIISWVFVVLISPVLVTLAGIKFALLWLVDKSWLLEKAAESIGLLFGRWQARQANNQSYWKRVLQSVLTTVITVLVASISILLAKITNTSNLFVIAPTILTFLAVNKLFEYSNDPYDWKENPLPFWTILVPATVLWIPIEHYEQIAKFAVNAWFVLGTIIMAIIRWGVEYKYNIGLLSVLVVVAYLLIHFANKYGDDIDYKLSNNKEFAAITKKYEHGNIMGWGLLLSGVVGMLMYLYKHSNNQSAQYTAPDNSFGYLPLTVLSLIVLASIGLLLWLRSVEPKRVRMEEVFKSEVKNHTSDTGKQTFFLGFIYNTWMLKQEDRLSKIESLWVVFESVLHQTGYLRYYEYASAGKGVFEVLSSYDDCEWTPWFVKSLLNGENYASALTRYENSIQLKLETEHRDNKLSKLIDSKLSDFKAWVSTFLKPTIDFTVLVKENVVKPLVYGLIWPFVTLWAITRSIFLRLKKIVTDLYGIWVAFNEVCPHVAEEKDLQ